jgi:hypothetical protein
MYVIVMYVIPFLFAESLRHRTKASPEANKKDIPGLTLRSS